MSWIETYCGNKFDVNNPINIDIVDIAHSLSMQCRYNGHIKHFYSVAEHCVHISNFASRKNALWGLLHDAAEAYIGDVPKPIKDEIPEFSKIEDKLLIQIAKTFELNQTSIPIEIQALDIRILIDERRDLMLYHELDWGMEHTLPLDIELKFWNPAEAQHQFLNLYLELRKNKRRYDLKNFLESEEGNKALKDASDNADELVKKLRDEMKINPDELNKPMTI